MTKTYDMEIGSFIRFGMENAKHHWLKFLGVNLAALAVLIVLTFVAAGINGTFGLLVFVVTSIVFSFGIFANVIRLASHRGFSLKAFLPDLPVILNYIVGMFLLTLIVGIGLLLLIIPGIVLGVKFNLVPFLIVDKQMNFLEAMKESWTLTNGHLADISFGLLVGNILVQVLSFFVVTIPFLIPMAAFIYVYPYAQLVGLADAPASDSSEAPEGSPSPAV
jgi:hypothetical protein